jgi:hypothetical protein
MLLVAGPIVVIVALLAVVKRRVDAAAADAAVAADTTQAHDTPAHDTPAHDEPGPIRDGR